MLSIRLSSLKCIAFCWLRTHFVSRMYHIIMVYTLFVQSYTFSYCHVIYILKRLFYIISHKSFISYGIEHIKTI